MANILNKIDIPASTLAQLPNISNKTHEVQYINDLTFKRDRTNTGNVSWTSETSGIVYDTATDLSDINVYNLGETGLLNLLQKECSEFLMTANDFSSLGEHYTILQDVAISGGRYYKIAQIDSSLESQYFNQLSLLIGGVGDRNSVVRNYFFVDFSTDSHGTGLNVTRFSTTDNAVAQTGLDEEIYFGYNSNDVTNKIELWVYLASDMESLGITVLNNYEKNIVNIFEVGNLQQSLLAPTKFTRVYAQHLLKNSDTSNENMLLNSYFLKPINQRNQASYSIATANAVVSAYDMWKINSSVVGMTMKYEASLMSINIPIGTNADNAFVYQKVDSKNLTNNNYYTVQFCVDSDTNIKDFIATYFSSGSGTSISVPFHTVPNPNASNQVIVYGTFFVPRNIVFDYFEIGLSFNVSTTTSTTYLYWSKLEKGYFPTEYSIPNEQENLLKCQYYYYRVQNDNPSLLQPIGTGYSWIANQLTVMIKTPSLMRVAPTITFGNLTIRTHSSSSQPAVTGQNNIIYTTDGTISIVFTVSSGISVYAMGMLFLNANTNNNGGYIEFNAEL